MPNISVILPCYNVEKLIDRCLESIVRQSIGMGAFEIICVDDCSTDGTAAKLEEWEAKYPDNFMLVRCEVNARQGAARNIGLQYANGNYIAFIDSDDWVELDYLEKLYSVAVRGDYDIVYCGYERDFSRELTFFKSADEVFDADGNSRVNISGLNGTEYVIKCDDDRRSHIILPQISYSAWAKVIKKSFLLDNNLMFPENLTYEDAGWGSLVNLCFTRAYGIDEKLYHYFVNDTSTVLRGNSNHHLDCLTIQTQVWKEYEARGFMDKFYNELQVEHIYSAYLAGLKMAILRYEVPDYNIYLLLRELMIDRIGNYRENPYIKNGAFAELHMLMLTALDTPLSKAEFYEFAENIKRIGI